jgi:hypothetical protein
MSALPNPLHTEKKGPAQAKRPAKLNRHGRDPGSPGERTRDSSDFNTEKGYAPFFHAFLADWPRISSGHVSDVLFMWCLSKSLGRSVKKGESRPQSTLPFIVEDAASTLCCDVRSIQRELAGWKARKVAKVTSEGKGLVTVELLYRTWEALPNYKNVVSIETGAPEAETPEVDEEKAKPTRIELTNVPLPCKAGARSKGVKIDCGVKTFHLVNSSPFDLLITAMVQAGDFVLTAKVPNEWLQEAAKRASVSNGINDLNSPPRHGSFEVPSNGGSVIPPQKGVTVDHPRAAELIKIFDPLLAAGHVALLSSDLSSLSSACSAIQDCDHNYLVKFAMLRAARKIGSPRSVVAICTEALASWKASGVLDGAGLKVPTRAEIDEMCKRDMEKLRKDQAEINRRYKKS